MNYTYTIVSENGATSLEIEKKMENYENFSLLNYTQNALEAMDNILKYNPDLVIFNFDREANALFSMIDELYKYMDMEQIPIFIGLASSKDFAYDAIKSGFFDYWLNPMTDFCIRKSILRLTKQYPKSANSPTLCIKSYKDFRYLDTKEILYLKADSNATDFFMADGNTVSAFKTLKTFESCLPKNFIRVHQSYILNVNYVSRINYGKSVCFLKQSKLHLPFSKSYRKNVDILKLLMAKNTISALN